MHKSIFSANLQYSRLITN